MERKHRAVENINANTKFFFHFAKHTKLMDQNGSYTNDSSHYDKRTGSYTNPKKILSSEQIR